MRQRHRRAIIDAARALLDERESDGFTVDELADRADVSRRTVFNHFASVDDIVITACSEVLGELLVAFEALASAQGTRGSESSLFDEVTGALTSTDLVPPMAYLTRVLGAEQEERSARQAMMLHLVFTDASEHLCQGILRRHPEADELTTRLLVGALMSGLVVLHGQWFAATGGAVDARSRTVWAELLGRLIDLTRGGFDDPDASRRLIPPPPLPQKERHG